MKYIRYQNDDKIHIGVLENKIIHQTKYDNIIDAIEDTDLSYEKDVSLDDVKILTPTTPTKIVCIGLNYKDHAEELQMKLPEEPLLFIKPESAIVPTNSDVYYPESDVTQLDYEGELGIVIGKSTYKGIKQSSIAGYTIVNDITARNLQNKDGQWTRSKSFDTFAPIGPVVTTNIDAHNLNIKTYVNDEIKQNSNTQNMIFTPEDLIQFVSNIMTLKPGDIIASGTPKGVGELKIGDVVKIEIEDIGTLKNFIKEGGK